MKAFFIPLIGAMFITCTYWIMAQFGSDPGKGFERTWSNYMLLYIMFYMVWSQLRVSP